MHRRESRDATCPDRNIPDDDSKHSCELRQRQKADSVSVPKRREYREIHLGSLSDLVVASGQSDKDPIERVKRAAAGSVWQSQHTGKNCGRVEGRNEGEIAGHTLAQCLHRPETCRSTLRCPAEMTGPLRRWKVRPRGQVDDRVISLRPPRPSRLVPAHQSTVARIRAGNHARGGGWARGLPSAWPQPCLVPFISCGLTVRTSFRCATSGHWTCILSCYRVYVLCLSVPCLLSLHPPTIHCLVLSSTWSAKVTDAYRGRASPWSALTFAMSARPLG